jgi:hypothetical protein
MHAPLLHAMLLGQIAFENKPAHRSAAPLEKWIFDANRAIHLIVLEVF